MSQSSRTSRSPVQRNCPAAISPWIGARSAESRWGTAACNCARSGLTKSAVAGQTGRKLSQRARVSSTSICGVVGRSGTIGTRCTSAATTAACRSSSNLRPSTILLRLRPSTQSKISTRSCGIYWIGKHGRWGRGGRRSASCCACVHTRSPKSSEYVLRAYTRSSPPGAHARLHDETIRVNALERADGGGRREPGRQDRVEQLQRRHRLLQPDQLYL